MKHFERVGALVDVEPFLTEICSRPDLWETDTSRQKAKPAQRETQAICIRGQGAKAVLDSEARQKNPIRYRGGPTAMSPFFPIAEEFVEKLVESMNGSMGRAVIARLRPRGRIHPHFDDRLYWILRDRYHLVIKSPAGSYFRAGDEEMRMEEGELWWFDHTVEHDVYNDSDEERIHIIVDVLSPHSLKSFLTRLWRAPRRSLHAIGGAVLRGVGLRGIETHEQAGTGN
jgi:hypothetical protein